MNFEHFLSKRILNTKPYKNSISAPIIKIGVIAIAIGMIVMIISVGVGYGMQKEIKDKISSFESHITIQSFNNTINQNSSNPISPNKFFIDYLKSLDEIKNIETVISKFGIVRTTKDFDGIFFKGLESTYDFNNIKTYLVEGNIPVFSENFSNEVLISKILADKLKLKLNGSFQMVFSKSEKSSPSVIKLFVVGIYDSGFEELDSKFIFGDIKQIRRILKWDDNQFSSLEIYLHDQKFLDSTSETIYLNSPSDYDVLNVKEKYFSIYEWVELFNKNIYAIIFIMILVASVNIISVLLVLILERTNMIGILKTLGLPDKSLQKFFIYTSSYLILIGMLLGNMIGLLILYLQKKYKLISLDPSIYYVDTVPVFIEFKDIISLNIIVFFLCVISIFVPSKLVSTVNPKDSIKFN